MAGPLSTGTASAGWVIDASATHAWVLSGRGHAVHRRAAGCAGCPALWAPTLWVLACTNVLQSAQRRRRIDADRRADIASQSGELPVRLDTETPGFVSLDRLAATQGLSAYDAACLELALRRSLVLDSLDARLIAAARALGHPVVSPTDVTR